MGEETCKIFCDFQPVNGGSTRNYSLEFDVSFSETSSKLKINRITFYTVEDRTVQTIKTKSILLLSVGPEWEGDKFPKSFKRAIGQNKALNWVSLTVRTSRTDSVPIWSLHETALSLRFPPPKEPTVFSWYGWIRRKIRRRFGANNREFSGFYSASSWVNGGRFCSKSCLLVSISGLGVTF